jgi:predicted transcriptional regulator of viral defense system
MNARDKLFEAAERQQGFFTSKQAEECGIHRTNFHRKLRSGEWVKEQRGIYRLAHYPLTDRPELVLWSLWSRDKLDRPQGIWSHATALDIHELSDIMPSKMHMTVPNNFRRRSPIPKLIKLHFGTLEEKDVETWPGYKVTTPLRTIIDVIEEGVISPDLIQQAIRDGMKKGTFSIQDLNDMKHQHPKVKEFSDWYLHEHKVQKRG